MTQTPPRRYRWFQFSLRTMFVVVALLAIPLAWIVEERRQSRYELRIAEQLREMGCQEATLILGGPYDLRELSLDGKPQGWWRYLARVLLGERIVGVWGLNPDSADPTLLVGLKSFQTFNFSKTEATDLTILPRLPYLRSLFLTNTKISDLTPLVGLTDLEVLVLNSTLVSDLTPLAGLVHLQSLGLHHPQVRDLTPLVGLTDLQSLHITYSQVIDLKPLVMLKKLSWLDLEGSPVEDLTPLTEMTSLRYLRVKGTRVSKDQIEVLQKALPNCEIDHEPFL